MAEVLGGDSFFATLALPTGYEIVEPSISTIVGVESTVNQQCDVAVGLLGWAASAFRD